MDKKDIVKMATWFVNFPTLYRGSKKGQQTRYVMAFRRMVAWTD